MMHTLQDVKAPCDEFMVDVIAGLSSVQKTLPCKYLYDKPGSDLFEKITELPEYYQTRTERQILNTHGDAMAALIGPAASLVEFGPGSSDKIGSILSRLERPFAYVPVEISREYLLFCAAAVAREFPHLHTLPVCADYTQPFSLPELARSGGTVAGIFFGTTIGQFTHTEAVTFLTNIRQILGPGARMIVGADLVKDEQLLFDAYNDSAEGTGRFNLNLLHRINRELGGTFNVANFRHHAPWNRDKSRIELHLVSECEQTATVAGHSFHFREGESIHTLNSHKYTVESFQDLARSAGYTPLNYWIDEKALFSVHALEIPAQLP